MATTKKSTGTGSTKTLATKRTSRKGTSTRTLKNKPKGKGRAQASKKERTPKREDGLNGRQITILKALAASKNGMTRAELKDKTGITKGYSQLMGAPTKEGFGNGGDGLEPAGLVKSETHEDRRGLVYTLTAKGRKVAAKA